MSRFPLSLIIYKLLMLANSTEFYLQQEESFTYNHKKNNLAQNWCSVGWNYLVNGHGNCLINYC